MSMGRKHKNQLKRETKMVKRAERDEEKKRPKKADRNQDEAVEKDDEETVKATLTKYKKGRISRVFYSADKNILPGIQKAQKKRVGAMLALLIVVQ